jgi:hypothetical protein
MTTLSTMTRESPMRQWQCLAVGVVEAWCGITLRQWAWTTGIALVLVLANMVGLLPPLLLISPQAAGTPIWTAARTAAAMASGLASGYCFLLALGIAERDKSRSRGRAWRYVVAGCAATGAAVVIDSVIFLLMPNIDPRRWSGAEPSKLIGFAVWAAANIGLSGGLVLAVYARFQSARLARDAFNSAELERVGTTRELLAARLAAMQAQVEPQFLLGTLAQVEALYDRDLRAGDRMLEGLIAYLRAALPQLRSTQSTLAQEMRLAESYLAIVQLRMGSRLRYTVDAGPGLGENDFPPMLLLPLIDDALRSGLEPLPHGGTIAISASTDGGRARVRVADDGLPRTAGSAEGAGIGLLHDRLRALYGDRARLELSANVPQGAIATIEVPFESTRAHR